MEVANIILEYITLILNHINDFLDYVIASQLPEQTGYAIGYSINAWFTVYLPVIAHWLEVIIFER